MAENCSIFICDPYFLSISRKILPVTWYQSRQIACSMIYKHTIKNKKSGQIYTTWHILVAKLWHQIVIILSTAPLSDIFINALYLKIGYSDFQSKQWGTIREFCHIIHHLKFITFQNTVNGCSVGTWIWIDFIYS